MRRSTAAALVMAMVVSLAGCSARALPELDLAAAAGDAAPLPETSVLLDGGLAEVAATVRAAAAAGRPTVVNLFASWCAPCEEELPLLLARSAADPRVRWIGVASQDRRQDAEPFIARMGVTWATVLDPAATVHVALDGIAMPTTAFFDADGELVEVVIGQLDEEQLDEALARILP